MRRILIPFLLFTIISCSSYTIADGRANIVLPEETMQISTKADKTLNKSGVSANALFLYIGEDEIQKETIDNTITIIKDISPDLIILLGSKENQSAFRSYFDQVYNMEGVSIIVSDRPFNTQTINLYIENFPAILAETTFPILPSY